MSEKSSDMLTESNISIDHIPSQNINNNINTYLNRNLLNNEELPSSIKPQFTQENTQTENPQKVVNRKKLIKNNPKWKKSLNEIIINNKPNLIKPKLLKSIKSSETLSINHNTKKNLKKILLSNILYKNQNYKNKNQNNYNSNSNDIKININNSENNKIKFNKINFSKLFLKKNVGINSISRKPSCEDLIPSISSMPSNRKQKLKKITNNSPTLPNIMDSINSSSLIEGPFNTKNNLKLVKLKMLDNNKTINDLINVSTPSRENQISLKNNKNLKLFLNNNINNYYNDLHNRIKKNSNISSSIDSNPLPLIKNSKYQNNFQTPEACKEILEKKDNDNKDFLKRLKVFIGDDNLKKFDNKYKFNERFYHEFYDKLQKKKIKDCDKVVKITKIKIGQIQNKMNWYFDDIKKVCEKWDGISFNEASV